MGRLNGVGLSCVAVGFRTSMLIVERIDPNRPDAQIHSDGTEQ